MNSTNTMQPPSPPPAGGISFWTGVEHIVLLATLFGVVISYRVASRKRETRRIEPNPLRVRNVYPKALDSDCKQRHQAALNAVALLVAENDLEHKRLYDQIDTVERRGADGLANALSRINEMIRNMPQEMLNLLSITGQLKDHDEKD